jgi:hypothetical protein
MVKARPARFPTHKASEQIYGKQEYRPSLVSDATVVGCS